MTLPIRPHPQLHLGGRRTGLTFLAVFLLLYGCGATAQPAHVETNFDSFRQRPFTTSALTLGSPCPVSPEVRLSNPPLKAPAYGYGRGPVYLTGQTEWYSGEAAVLMVDPAYSEALLIRGKQLDGAQPMPLGPASTQGDLELTSSSSANWRVWTGQIVATGSGCFGIQADGTDFTEVIVFKLRPGTPLPA